MTAPMIEFRNVTKVFGGGLFDKNRTVALEKYSMKLHDDPPLITAIVGESGSGKNHPGPFVTGLGYADRRTGSFPGPGYSHYEQGRATQLSARCPIHLSGPLWGV